MRVQSSELVANLFQECDPAKGDYHGLCKYVLRCIRCRAVHGLISSPACSPSAIWANVFLLTLTALAKVGFTAWTFGMMVRRISARKDICLKGHLQVPAGIFLPTITIGASLGRAVGLITFV